MPQNLNFEEQAQAALMHWCGEDADVIQADFERAWRIKGRVSMPRWDKEWPRIEEISDRAVDLLALGIKTDKEQG